jgi:hypothetical protein
MATLLQRPASRRYSLAATGGYCQSCQIYSISAKKNPLLDGTLARAIKEAVLKLLLARFEINGKRTHEKVGQRPDLAALVLKPVKPLWHCDRERDQSGGCLGRCVWPASVGHDGRKDEPTSVSHIDAVHLHI